MKKKTVIGIALIVISVAAMYIWESAGRDRILLDQVMCAAVDISEGDAVTSDMFALTRVLPENRIEGSLTAEDLMKVTGKIAASDIKARSQISLKDFTDELSILEKGSSIYLLSGNWIYSRSSALRAGDMVHIYAMPEKLDLGSYKLAFVRDVNEQEVVSSNPGSPVLRRSSGSAVISSLEIICSAEEYFSIFDTVQLSGPNCLLVVMENEV